MSPLEQALIIAIIGTVAGVLGKIVFDWLKHTRLGDKDPQEDRRACVPMVLCDERHGNLEKIDKGLQKQIDKGAERYETIQENTASINTKLAVIATNLKINLEGG